MTSAGRVTARDQLPRRDTRCTQLARPETEAGTAEGIRYTAPGRQHPSSCWLPELLRPGKAQNAGPTESAQAQPSPRVCGITETLNLSGLSLGRAGNSGPAPWRAAWSLSSVDGESTCRERGQTVWSEHCRSSPHRPVTFVCSAPPSPRHDWTREPEQETTSARLCQGGN